MSELQYVEFPHISEAYGSQGRYLTVHEKHLNSVLEIQRDLQATIEKLQPEIDGYWKLIRQCQDQKQDPPVGIQHLVYSLEGQQQAYSAILHRINGAVSGRG